jgi:hypothetical protein
MKKKEEALCYKICNSNMSMSIKANAVQKIKEVSRFPLGSSILLGRAMTQLVEALHYKPKGSGFDYRLGHYDFSST